MKVYKYRGVENKCEKIKDDTIFQRDFLTNEVMWAHYASSNRGYCIEYDRDKLKDKTINFDFAVELDVTYSDEIPTLTFEDIKGNSMFKKMFGLDRYLSTKRRKIYSLR